MDVCHTFSGSNQGRNKPTGGGTLKRLHITHVARIADNYNHLFEQPTLFYAIALAIAVMGHGDQTAVTCASSFVILRVGHSLIQSTINIVMLRLAVFTLSWIVLLIMMVREALVIF